MVFFVPFWFLVFGPHPMRETRLLRANHRDVLIYFHPFSTSLSPFFIFTTHPLPPQIIHFTLAQPSVDYYIYSMEKRKTITKAALNRAIWVGRGELFCNYIYVSVFYSERLERLFKTCNKFGTKKECVAFIYENWDKPLPPQKTYAWNGRYGNPFRP